MPLEIWEQVCLIQGVPWPIHVWYSDGQFEFCLVSAYFLWQLENPRPVSERRFFKRYFTFWHIYNILSNSLFFVGLVLKICEHTIPSKSDSENQLIDMNGIAASGRILWGAAFSLAILKTIKVSWMNASFTWEFFHFQKHSKEIFCHLRRKNCKQSEVITFLVLSFFWPAGNSKLLYESIFFSLLINFRMILQKNTFWGTCMSNIAFHLLYYSIHVYNISYWFAPQMGIASKSMGPVILALNYMMKVLWIIYLNH